MQTIKRTTSSGSLEINFLENERVMKLQIQPKPSETSDCISHSTLASLFLAPNPTLTRALQP